MRRQGFIIVLLCAAPFVRAGEIIIVEPAREKAQAPTLIIKSGPPPTETALAREKARAWVTPPDTSNTARCHTENTVGSIEGNVQGHTVIQGNASGVTVCK